MFFASQYKKIKPSIVAIVSRYSTTPDFPEILGTGFIAKEDGVIVTNNHVIDVIKQLPRRKEAPEEWPIAILYLHDFPGEGMGQIFLEVEGVGTLGREAPVEGINYGPDIPDIGLIFVKTVGLPSVEIEATFNLNEGDEVYVSGYPMGTKTLRAPGWIHQIGPTLQRGIVAAVQPFPCEKPHGILVDAVTQGGSSGSPIFNPATGKVAALLYGGIEETRVAWVTKEIPIPYRINTSLTCAIPGYIVSEIMKLANNVLYDRATGQPTPRDTSKHPSLQHLLDTYERVRETPKSKASLGAKVIPNSDLEFPASQ